MGKYLANAILLLGAASFGVMGTADAAAPSFDCRRATSADEKAICANDTLAKMDVLISAAYKIYRPDRQSKRAVGMEILNDRRACGADDGCILAVQLNALATFEVTPSYSVKSELAENFQRRALAAAARKAGYTSPMPTMIGNCVLSLIAEIATRFGEPLKDAEDSAGSSVSFSNRGFQVSYQRESPLVQSRAGDEVAICLISKPRDCPSGDDRGRVYYTLNLRTNSSWELPDASHMCGGA